MTHSMREALTLAAARIQELVTERDEWKAAVDDRWPGVYSKWTNACAKAESERVRANLAEDRAQALEAENGRMREALTKVRDRFFHADQPERDRDLYWDLVNSALAGEMGT